MLLESFKITGSAVSQILLIAALGYFLMKRNLLGEAGLEALSRLAIDVALPILIFCQLLNDFSFTVYPHWWVFPLLSIGITSLGLAVGALFLGFIGGRQHKLQFLSLVGFQNSGYLPLALLAALLPKDKLETMFIYLFLFLLGFNLVMFSLGIYMLAFSKAKRFEVRSLFSPPVVATLLSLGLVFLGLNRLVPGFVLKPLRMVGDATVPLAMLVTGANLAKIRLTCIDKKAMVLMIMAKLVILPLIGLFLVLKFKVPELVGLLILLELAVPPAVNSSVIVRAYSQEDLLVSQGIFIGHILSIFTIPIFLSLYFVLNVVR